MKAIVIKQFYDKQDKEKHVYKVGDEFPKEGTEVEEARLKELSTNINATGYPLIKIFKLSNQEKEDKKDDEEKDQKGEPEDNKNTKEKSGSKDGKAKKVSDK